MSFFSLILLKSGVPACRLEACFYSKLIKKKKKRELFHSIVSIYRTEKQYLKPWVPDLFF